MVRWWQPALFAAMAGGMAWGIRGQYGHETGAMIAGLLVSLVTCLLLCPTGQALAVSRGAALCTIAMGFGGSMTYGQTVGLTHDAALVGNYGALMWGMLGLAIKGALWIGFAGLFLGIGLSGIRYKTTEIALLMLGAILAFVAGVFFFNEPFDPASRRLPLIYFSDDWYWEPDGKLEPRREVWGGYVVALAYLVGYCGWMKRDSLAPRLAAWGCLGGAIGFPLGQCGQSFHAWNRELFASAWLQGFDSIINWWNFMETTFGAVMGAALGLGLWINRHRIRVTSASQATVTLPAFWEIGLIGLHIVLLAAAEFSLLRYFGLDWSKFVLAFYGYGLGMGLLPTICVAGGRWSAYLMLLPITALPIAGKTYRQLVINELTVTPMVGCFIYLVFPLVLTTLVAIALAQSSKRNPSAESGLRIMLFVTAWLYFWLNFAFFKFPWPWQDWTARTPNAVVFSICLIGLTYLSSRSWTAGVRGH